MTIFEIITISQSIIFTLSIIVGGIWAVYRYNRRNESASINVNIDNIQSIKKLGSQKNIILEVIIENIGKREVKLYYDFKPKKNASKYENPEAHYQSKILLYKVENDGQYKLVDEKTGLLSNLRPHHTGRFRPGVIMRLPYLFCNLEQGLYFIEFFIDINMLSYYKKNDKNDIPIKQWTDRKFYTVE